MGISRCFKWEAIKLPQMSSTTHPSTLSLTQGTSAPAAAGCETESVAEASPGAAQVVGVGPGKPGGYFLSSAPAALVSGPFEGGLSAVALAFNGEDVGVADETIDGGDSSCGLVGEDALPRC